MGSSGHGEQSLVAAKTTSLCLPASIFLRARRCPELGQHPLTDSSHCPAGTDLQDAVKLFPNSPEFWQESSKSHAKTTPIVLLIYPLLFEPSPGINHPFLLFGFATYSW